MNITKDETWGWILIAAGVVLLLYRPGNRIHDWLTGAPDHFITAGLVITLMIYAVITVKGSPELRAVALAWAITP